MWHENGEEATGVTGHKEKKRTETKDLSGKISIMQSNTLYANKKK